MIFDGNLRLFYKWTVHGKSPSITTDPNTVQNESKLTALVMRVKLLEQFYRHDYQIF